MFPIRAQRYTISNYFVKIIGRLKVREISDSGAVAVAVTAGVAVGMAAASSGSRAAAYALAACAGLLTAACLAAAALRAASRGQLAILYATAFAAGIWSAASSCVLGEYDMVWGPAQRAGDSLDALVAGMPFENEDARSLVRAMLLGRRDGLSPELKAAFRGSGASHLLALSGLHIGLIYLMLEKALSIFGNRPQVRKARSVLGIMLSGFFTLMTGATPSMVRAFLFISCREVAKLSGREASLGSCLACALTIQLLLSPSQLQKVGFQLSYLAMAGIVFLFPPLRDLFPKKAAFRREWELCSMAISCQAFTAPLSWYHFHSFPKYFLLTNLMTAPLMSILMFLSIIAIALSAVGLCPLFLVKADELACRALIYVLGIISSM